MKVRRLIPVIFVLAALAAPNLARASYSYLVIVDSPGGGGETVGTVVFYSATHWAFNGSIKDEKKDGRWVYEETCSNDRYQADHYETVPAEARHCFSDIYDKKGAGTLTTISQDYDSQVYIQHDVAFNTRMQTLFGETCSGGPPDWYGDYHNPYTKY